MRPAKRRMGRLLRSHPYPTSRALELRSQKIPFAPARSSAATARSKISPRTHDELNFVNLVLIGP